MRQWLELRDGVPACPGCAAQLEDGVLDHREGCAEVALIVAGYGRIGGTGPDDDTPLPELLGMAARAVWVAWALRQPSTRASWLLGWDQLSEADRDAYRKIGLALYAIGQDDLAVRLREVVRGEYERARRDGYTEALPPLEAVAEALGDAGFDAWAADGLEDS